MRPAEDRPADGDVKLPAVLVVENGRAYFRFV